MMTTETVPHRTLLTPTPQDETSSTGDCSRLLLCLPLAVFFFFVGFFLCRFKKFPKQKKLSGICVTQTSTLNAVLWS
ncbi:hypothetical protein CHARACLAT_025875 [Characodon lateralis]|uniref:Uncharacterized protein n=1 Tax=Characodon lateralis TaxID=208331 RepID=A0ABU7EMC2_9TELE|nr:hypothetical protein [Characodon lateralis]